MSTTSTNSQEQAGSCCGTARGGGSAACEPAGAPVVVLKFGSSVLPDEASLPTAVHEIYRHVRAGRRVVAVVSALGDTTDRLLSRAQGYVPSPDPGALAAWVATGEAQAAALLGLAVDRGGTPVTVLDSGAIGLRTTGAILDGGVAGLDASAIRAALDRTPVLVVPGFIGRDELGRATLLGRGGSDLTALFIAAELRAERCVLLKDVDGLYDSDPATNDRARRYQRVSYEDVLALSEGIVQHKGVRFARDRGVEFSVACIGKDEGTTVGGSASRFHPASNVKPGEASTGEGIATNRRGSGPLRVGLLGFGTVGRGVYEQLAARPELFDVVGIAVRDVEKHVSAGGPADLLTTDAWGVVRGEVDVVVETIGGLEPAGALIAAALRLGRDVVTANKAVIAAEHDRLAELAGISGSRLLFSAAVGGGVPVIEVVRLAGERTEIEAIEGVLNGTTNFVLDRLAEGVAFEDAVKLAQALGFAEADPSADLDGIDAANKLAVLARVAFGIRLPVSEIETRGIRGLPAASVIDAKRAGGAVRLVGRLARENGRITATVAPRVLAAGHPLASSKDEGNIVQIRGATGVTTTVAGRGAGRWPTAQSVIADLFDLVHEAAGAGRGGDDEEASVERSSVSTTIERAGQGAREVAA